MIRSSDYVEMKEGGKIRQSFLEKGDNLICVGKPKNWLLRLPLLDLGVLEFEFFTETK